MILLGEALLTSDSTNGTDYYTTWATREGPRVVVPVQVLSSAGSSDISALTATVQTKQLDESDGQAVAAGSSASISLTTDVTSIDRGETLGGGGDDVLKQLVRLKINLKAAASGNKPAWAYIRILDLAWSRD